ncbi:MAG TPA: two-component regulator propeller domain-containing protein, partial [Bacteroidia bacterium]|nr:two-component regulator propeller domain-containing protein [Bacteroidia bacterium]
MNSNLTNKYYKCISRSVLCCIFMFILFFSKAQTLNLNQFGIEEGLPQSSIYTMLQGKYGSIWVGTMNGVSKYNGLTFENYTKKDGLAENRVTSSCMDKDGNIWFGHWSGGITRYDVHTKVFSEVVPGTIKISKTITSIVMDNNGTIWFGTNGEGLIKNEDGKFSLFTTKDGLAGNNIAALMVNKDGVLWIGTDKGITLFKKQFQPFEKPLQSNAIKCFLRDKKDNIWIGTADKGIIRINSGKEEMTNFTVASGLASNNIRTIFQAMNDAIFIGTYSDGVSKYIPQLEANNYKGSFFTTISTQHGLSNDHIFSIIQDREKNIWIGTQLNLNQYFDEQFEIFGENDGLKNSLVWSVIQDRNKNFWVGTEGGLFKFIPDIHSSQLTSSEKLSGKSTAYHFIQKTGKNGEILNTSALYEDIKGNIWYTDFGRGVSRFNPSTNEIKRFTKENGLPVNEIYSINGDKNGNIWIGTNKGGLLKFDIVTEKFQTYTTKDGLGSNQIYSIFQDSKSRLWLGCLSGNLTMFDPLNGTNFKTFSKAEGYPANFTLCITEDKRGNIWLGTFDQGIYKYDGTSFKN